MNIICYTIVYLCCLASASELSEKRVKSKLRTDAENILAGTVGGTAMVYAGQPLDRAKVMLQTTKGQYSGTLDCLRKVFTQQGIRGLYAGATASVYAEASANAIMYGSYRAFRRELEATGMGSQMASVLSGALSGVLVSAVYGPLDLIKIRLQTSAERMGPLECVSKILRTEGVRGLTRGLEATIARTVPQVAVYYYAYGAAKEDYKLDPLIAGGIAGMACWAVGLPLDAIKTRIQASEGLSLMNCTRQIMREAGPAGFYKGWRPVMLRAAIANAVCFKAIETTQSALSTIE